jgi:hypothetical protein
LAGKLSIRWRGDTQLSAIHAAYVVASDAVCADRKTQQALVAPATEINNRLLSASVDVASFWQRLFAEYAFDSASQRAVEIALIAAGGSELQLEQTAAAISNRLGECRLAFQSRFPKLADQLELRIGPLKQRWNEVGSELLSTIANRIWDDQPPADWWPARVTGIAVQPMRGGDGDYDSDAVKFWIEALLNDADPDVPEVLRVAWLLTQLAIQIQMREKSSETVSGMPWTLGSVPIVLSASVDAGITDRGDDQQIETALRLWRLGDGSTAGTLHEWWNQWQQNKSPMPLAVKGLDKMLGDSHKSARRDGPGESGPDLPDFNEL